MSSEQVMFPSGTVRCAANLYLPDDIQETVPIPCGGYLAHPFANQMDVLLISSYFSELWHSQIKEYKSISRVYLYYAEHTLFIFSFCGS